MKLLTKKALRDLFGNKGRIFITFLAMVMGTTVFGTFSFVQSMISRDILNVFTASSPASAVLLVNKVDDELLALLDSDDNIAAYEIGATHTLTTQNADGVFKKLQLFSSNDFPGRKINKVTAMGGQTMPKRDELLLESDALGVAGVQMGDSIDITLPDETVRAYPIVGLVNDLSQHPPSIHNEVYAYVSPDTLADMGLSMNRVDFMVSGNAYDREHILDASRQVIHRLESVGYQIAALDVSDTPGISMHLEEYKGALFILQVFSIVAFLFSGMIMSSLFSTILTSQVKQIGILKAIGAKRSLVMASYTGSAVLLIVANLAIACPLSMIASRFLSAFFLSIGNMHMQNYAIPSYLLYIFLSVSFVLPFVLALLPIHKGLAVTVKEALSSAELPIAKHRQRKTQCTIARKVPRTILFSIRSALENRRRFSMNLAMLTLGGLLFVSVVGTIFSINSAISTSLDAQKFDYQIIAGASVPETQIDAILADTPKVKQYEVWDVTSGSLVYDDSTLGNLYSLMALESNSTFYDPHLQEGRWLKEDDTNAVVVSYEFFEREPAYAIGSIVSFQIGGSRMEFQIVGTIKEIGSPSIYVNQPWFVKNVPEDVRRSSIQMITEQTQRRPRDGYKEIVDSVAGNGFSILQAESKQDKNNLISSHHTTTLISFLVVAIMVVFVAGFGLATTIRVQVAQRTREIGVLKAVGARERQVYSIITTESTFISFACFLICLILCVPVSQLALYVIGDLILQMPLLLSVGSIAISMSFWLALILIVGRRASKRTAKKAAALTVKDALLLS